MKLPNWTLHPLEFDLTHPNPVCKIATEKTWETFYPDNPTETLVMKRMRDQKPKIIHRNPSYETGAELETQKYPQELTDTPQVDNGFTRAFGNQQGFITGIFCWVLGVRSLMGKTQGFYRFLGGGFAQLGVKVGLQTFPVHRNTDTRM